MGKRPKEPVVARWMMAHLSRYDDEFLSNGDLREEYHEIAEKRGRWPAYLWYWMQVLYALPSNVKHHIVWSLNMIWNYMKIAFRYFRKQKIYSSINIFGLSVGLMSSFLIFLWIQDEWSFDRHYPNADRMYSVGDFATLPSGERRYSTPTPPILATFLKGEYPEVTHATRLFTPAYSLGNEEQRFVEDVAMVDADFLEMFGLRFLDGGPGSAFADLHSIVITTSFAEKLFGADDPMGQIISLEGRSDLTVRGIVEKLPDNIHLSHCDFMAFIPIQILDTWGRSMETWEDHSFKTYIQIHREADPVELEAKVAEVYLDNTPDQENRLYLQPVTAIHLHDMGGGGLITYIYLFSGMAVFILIIACINYMNLATARSTTRTLEVGLRRTIGADRRQLVRQFLGESIFTACVSVLIAFILVLVFLPAFNQIVGKSLRLSTSLVPPFFGIAIVVGLTAGSYPAFYLTRTDTVGALKGGMKSRGGSSFRRIMVVFQFALSIVLIIGTGIINGQVRYMHNRPLGYDSENILCLTLTTGIDEHYDSIRNELIQHSNIESLSRANTTMDSWESSTTFENFRWEEKTESHDKIRLALMGADEDFFETFRLEIAVGRFFERDHSSDPREAIVLNETAIRVMGIQDPMESVVRYANYRFQVIGVIRDFHYSSMHDAIEPLAIVLNWSIDNVLIRITNSNVSETLKFIEETIRRFVPGYTLDYEFLDTRLDRLYRAENRMESIALLMTLLAVIVSCLGLLGLASFSAEQRTKEIGIRKVLGSSVSGILRLLVREFVRWVLLANVFAWPIAYFLGSRWLQNFAYRAPMQAVIFLGAGVGALVLAILTVSYQSVKAARANPVDSLRYE